MGPAIRAMSSASSSSSAEEVVEAPRLDELDRDLLLEIIDQLTCDLGLSGLAGSCKALRAFLCEPARGELSHLDHRLAALADLRGWRAAPMRVQSRISCRRRDQPHHSYEQRPAVPPPPGWDAYGCRLRSLPPPHTPWPLEEADGAGRTLTVGRGKNSWAHFSSVRAAVDAARDGDTVMLLGGGLDGVFDEGLAPIELTHSIRLVGSALAETSGIVQRRPHASVLRAVLVASAGHGSLSGLTLELPAQALQPPPPALPNVLAELLAGGDVDGDDVPEGPTRCFKATQSAVWLIEDCRVVGGVRAGSTSELAIVGCHVTAAHAMPPSTGVLVQGSARLLVRTSVIDGHARSGLTAQHGSQLWLDHSSVCGNALAGIKLSSRAPCVIRNTSIARNGHFGVLLRDRSSAQLLACEMCDNATSGLAVIQKSTAIARGCEMAANEQFGAVCQHEARLHLSHSIVQRNGNVGVMVAQEAAVSLYRTSCVSNGGDGCQTDMRATLLLHGTANLLRGSAGDIASPSRRSRSDSVENRSDAASDDPDAASASGSSVSGPHVRSTRLAAPAPPAPVAANGKAVAGDGGAKPAYTQAGDVGPSGAMAREEWRAARLNEWHPAMLVDLNQLTPLDVAALLDRGLENERVAYGVPTPHAHAYHGRV